MFTDTLAHINQKLHDLDVKLTNARINHVRNLDIFEIIKTETSFYNKLFESGMSTTNTAKMLASVSRSWASSYGTSDISMENAVFEGFLALLLTPGAEKLSKIAYPETFLLDIIEIGVNQKILYGLWAQAALLVVVNQRLSESSVKSEDFDEILEDITYSAAFQMLLWPICDISSWQQKASIESAVTVALREVTQIADVSGILREVERETSNFGYPTTPIASSIAMQWSQEMRGVVLGTTFRPHIGLPKAAMKLADKSTSMMAEIVLRVKTNIDVHRPLYNKLYAELVLL